MASSSGAKNVRKRTLTVKQVATLLMDSDEESVGNDSYDSSELETESDDDESRDTAVDTSEGALLTCIVLPVLHCVSCCCCNFVLPVSARCRLRVFNQGKLS